MQVISSASPSRVGAPLEQPSFVVASSAMTELLAMAARAAESPAKVLITGESGVGKDVVARYIHSQSSRRLAPFVAVNCRRRHRNAPRVGALRTRQGQLHRRLPRQARQAPARASRHAVSRRSRRDEPAHAGAAAAVSRERRDPGRRLRPIAGACRRARDRRHQSQPERPRRRRPVPRGPPVPAARHPPPRAAAPGAGRGRPGADAAFPRGRRARSQLHGRGASGAAELPVAGQRPRAPERRRTAASGCRRAASSGSSTCPSRCAANPGCSRRPPIAAAGSPTSCTTRSSSKARRSGSTSIRCFWLATSRATILRELVRRGLRESRGRYKAMLTLFGMSSRDYRRFMNFLAAHDCGVGFREFRETASSPQAPAEMPPVYSVPADAPVKPRRTIALVAAHPD